MYYAFQSFIKQITIMGAILEFKDDKYEGLVEYINEMIHYGKKIKECIEESEYNTRKHHSEYSDGDYEDEDMRYRRMGGRYSRY